MRLKVNETKLQFKKYFLEFCATQPKGTFLRDEEIAIQLEKQKIHLTKQQTKDAIRALENKIGKSYQMRLKRVRNEGYEILAGQDHATHVKDISQKQIRGRIKKAATRTKFVDANLLPAHTKAAHEEFRRSITALSVIVSDVNEGLQQLTKAVTISYELKALEALKKDL